jgi:hypothetical protein
VIGTELQENLSNAVLGRVEAEELDLFSSLLNSPVLEADQIETKLGI